MLIAAPLAGNTFNALALVLVMKTVIPATAVGNTTPLAPLATVLTTLIDLVSAVAVPCVVPAALMPVPTELIIYPEEIILPPVTLPLVETLELLLVVKTPVNNVLPLKDYLKHRQLSIPNLDVYHRPHHNHQKMVHYELN